MGARTLAEMNQAVLKDAVSLGGDGPDKQATGNREKQKSLYVKAENDIASTVRQFPDLGGPVWKPRYDQLAKDIQRSLGKAANGVKSYAKQKTAAP